MGKGAPPSSTSRGYLSFINFPRLLRQSSGSTRSSSSRRQPGDTSSRSSGRHVRQSSRRKPQHGQQSSPRQSRLPSLQRKQSSSSDALEFAKSVLTPPTKSLTASQAKGAAGTPRAIADAANRPCPEPAEAEAPLTRTLSNASVGSYGYGSMYGGFDNNDAAGRSSRNNDASTAAANSFYGNVSSFYGGFDVADGLQASSRSNSFILSGAQAPQSMYGNPYGLPYINTGDEGESMSASSEVDSFDADGGGGGGGLSASPSSGRSLRRLVSFSGVPPSLEERQRTVAHRPKRVGSRRLSAPTYYEAERAARNAVIPPQQQQQQDYPYQQQEQPATPMVNGTAPLFRGYESGSYTRSATVNPYGGYSMSGPSYGNSFASQSGAGPVQEQQQQQSFVQPRYNAYGGANYSTFSNGTSMGTQSRPVMQGFYY